MTGKASAVFWIGLLLILINFWVSGQSTTFWDMLTNTSGKSAGNPVQTTPNRTKNPLTNPKVKNPHGFVQ